MDVTIRPGAIAGTVAAIPSKSEAHRALICAAFAQGPTRVACKSSSADIDATVSCLTELGAQISHEGGMLDVSPIPRGRDRHPKAREGRTLDCGESGSTLRFMLPVVAALGCNASLTGRGRLAERPLSPLYELLVEHGAVLSPQGSFPLKVGGRLSGGVFELPGDVSSQYVSGLLLAAAVTDIGVEVRVDEPVQSLSYVSLTCRTLRRFGIAVETWQRQSKRGSQAVWHVAPDQLPGSEGDVAVPGDWSNAAFWLCAGALAGSGVTVTGLDAGRTAGQGDRAIMAILARMGARVVRGPESVSVMPGPLVGCDLDVSDTPDLVPPIAVVAACAEGTTRIRGAARLRLKESDRIATVSAALRALGATVEEHPDGIDVHGVGTLSGGTVDAANDHRIAMMAAISAARSSGAVTIAGADCVAKSYPSFYDDLALLGGVVTREG